MWIRFIELAVKHVGFSDFEKIELNYQVINLYSKGVADLLKSVGLRTFYF